MLCPRPSLRVESIKPQGQSDKVVISSSILDHQSVCNTTTLRSNFSDNYVTAGKAGLNPEEASFLINKYDFRNPVIVAGLYFLLAEQNYATPKHLWYRGQISGRLLERSPWTKTPSKVPMEVRGGIDSETRTIRKKTHELASRCNSQNYLPGEPDYRHFKFNYYQLSNDWKSTLHANLRLLPTLNENIVIIFPEVSFIPLEYIQTLHELKQELTKLGVTIFIPNLADLDEPWCLCGHLSDQGQHRIVQLLRDLK